MSKQVKQVDRVIIRFAGDSGDGMQLTGDRFTQESAAFGNDLVTLPNFPAEIRAPQGTLPGVSSFQVHFADHDILTAGDAPDVLVAMNPAALKANLADLPKGAAIIVDSHDFSDRNLTKAGYTSNPLESLGDANDQLGDFQVFSAGPDRDDRRGGQGVRPVPQGRRPRQEHVRARAAVVDVRPADPDHDRLPRQAVRQGRGHPRRQHRGVQGRLELRRDHRDLRRPVRSEAGPDGARGLPQHQRQPGAGLRAGRRQRAVRPRHRARHLPDHPGLRHPPRALQAQGVRRHDLPGRGRDRRHRRRHRCVVLRQARASPRPPVRASRSSPRRSVSR